MRLAADGQVDEARQPLESIPSDAIREWGVEHGQISGRFRSKVIGKTSPVRTPARGPRTASAALRDAILKRDGYTCRYCGLKVIPREVLIAFGAVVGSEHFGTGRANAARHGAALVSWAEVDHVVPFQRGGPTTPENLVTACWACNYGKDRYTVEELGIRGPRERPPKPGAWDGLTSLLPRLEAQITDSGSKSQTGLIEEEGGAGPRGKVRGHRRLHTEPAGISSTRPEGTVSRQGIEVDRRRFGEALEAYVGAEDRAAILEGLDRLIAWGTTQDRIAHAPYKGEQAAVQFRFVDTGHVFWSVFPRKAGGAKLEVLPRVSAAIPESLRKQVRSAIERIVEVEWPTKAAVPTLPLRLLARDPVWDAFRSVLDEVLAST